MSPTQVWKVERPSRLPKNEFYNPHICYDMKYVIISLESGRVEPFGPMLLIKANPIQEETVLGSKLPDTFHKESNNTQNFVFRISIELIDAFINALDDSKAEKRFWEPAMNDYVLDKIIDLGGKEISAYIHHSFELNQHPKPQDVLLGENNHLEKPISQSTNDVQNSSEMSTIQYYLSKQNNSFDGLLKEWDHEQPLYPYLVLITRENNLVINCSPIFWDWRNGNGFFLKQDRIIPNEPADDSIIPQLYLKSATRYYNIYEEDKHTGITYTFYSKDACHKIYTFFDEEGEGTHAIKPFSYKKMPRLLEDPSNPPDWMKDNMIDEEDIVGMVSIQATPIFSSEKPQAVFVLLMKRPYVEQEPHIFDIYEVFDFQKVFLQSKFLKSYSTKLLVWAFIHDLKKDSNLEGLSVMNDENNTKLFEDFVRNHYDYFTEEKKNESVMVFPDIYEKYIPSTAISQRLLTDNIMSLATIIRKWGVGGTYAISSIGGDKNVCNLMMTVAKKLFNNKSLIKSIPKEDWFPFISVLSYLNVMYNNNPKVKVPTGFWLYYYLYKYRIQCQQEDVALINTLIAFVLMSNSSSFMKLINENKGYECKVVLMRSGRKIVFDGNSWARESDESALYELIYYFSNECHGYWDGLTAEEQHFWPKRWDDEVGYDEILDYLNGSVHHTWMGIQSEREFYAKKLYEAIDMEQEKGNYCMLEYN